MLGFHGVAVVVPCTTNVHAARCDVCIEVGFSPSLPSSVPRDIALSVATSAWVHCVSQLSLLTLASFHCQLRVAEVKHLGWCDVQTFDGSLSTRYEEVSGIVNIRRMAGHARSVSFAH